MAGIAIQGAAIPLPDGRVPASSLRVVEVAGSGSAAGRIYGEACRDLIHQHLAAVIERLQRQRGLDSTTAFERTRAYRAATQRQYPHLADEIDGVAVGAGLPVEAAWALQLRAELMAVSEQARQHECTSVAVTGSASRDGGTLAGQNADLSELYRDLLVLLRRTDDGDRPRVATLTPAGQIGYHGMNDAGVAVFANFLFSGNWRIGVPRYLLTRVALAERDREAAALAIERTDRASSRNVVIADETGALNLESATTTTARLEPEDGLLAHTNHHLATQLEPLEQATALELENSRRRLTRVSTLLRQAHGSVDVSSLAKVLRDRDAVPDALCRAPGEWPDDVMTVASTIAEVDARRLWVAVGPPHEAAYFAYNV